MKVSVNGQSFFSDESVKIHFCISNTLISNARLKLAKNQTMPSNTLKLNFCYLEMVYINHPRYHLKIVEHILKNKQKNWCVCIHEII